MSVLDMHKVSVTLDNTEILQDISLHLDKGEFISILGPSGAGKSTIFRLLTGALTHTTGTIHCNQQPLDSAPQHFAFMPQRDALMPWRRIIDNLTLGLEIQGIPAKKARQQVIPLLDDFGLGGFEQHYPAQLSGGMRQRAALLRTVVQNRPIQLLDEPFGALDALTRTQMQQWLESRWQKAGWSTLLITHDVREAVALSDRIYVLSARPASIIAQVNVPIPRPRMGRPITSESHQLEDYLLNILLTQTGNL